MQAPRPSESPARPSLAFSWGGILFRTPPFQTPQADQPGIACDVSLSQQPEPNLDPAPLLVPVPDAETRSGTVGDDDEGIQNNHSGNEDELDSDHHGASLHHHSDDLSLEDDSTLVAKASTNTYSRARLAVSSSQASTCSQSDAEHPAPQATWVPAISERVDDDGGIKPDHADNPSPPAPADPRQSYTVHAITNFRIIDPYQNPKEVEFRISWEGYPDPSEDTWEDERELHETCPDLVFDFWTARSGRSAALGLPPNANFEVLRICRHQVSNRRRRGHGHRFLVEWVGYREKTWEPASHLPREILEEYFAAAGRA